MSERLNPVLLNILSVSADLTHGVTTSSNSKFYPFPSGEENIEKVMWAHQITADPRDRPWVIFRKVERFKKRRFTPGPNLTGL